jgi:photosystem II stability/assembly factor-like uncharacterized protein
MRRLISISLLAVASTMGSFAAFNCGGGGGGGGGWLVGKAGLVSSVNDDGKVGTTLTEGDDQLNAIACRYVGEAWVAGDNGTVLYTNDGGSNWSVQTVPTASNLRSVATQDSGPVFIVGDGVFLTTSNTGKTWTSLGNGSTSFVSVATAQEAATVLAVDSNGGVWSYDETTGALAQRTTVAGASAVAISPTGQQAVLVGAGVWLSSDGGVTWTAVSAASPTLALTAVSIDDDGNAVAVGAAGAIASFNFTGSFSVQHLGTAGFNALHIADPDDTDRTGYAVGEGGVVYITHDSGTTWELGPNVGKTVYGVDVVGLGHN